MAKATTLILFVVINYVMIIKYSMRITPYFWYLSSVYAILLTIVYIWSNQVKTAINKEKPLFFLFIVVFFICMIAVQYHFDPLQIKVDRWSAIENPITALFNGEYPYLAKTHLGGYASPFPILMLLHIPFWILGNVGLSSIFSVILFLFSVKVNYGYTPALKAGLLLFISICLWYEVSVRSDYITNFLLLATFINFILYKNISFNRKTYTLSAIAGLWLSTRLNASLPLFILFFVPWTKLSVGKKINSLIIIVLTFALTFAPLIIWDAHNLFFFEYNPFILQSRQTHITDILIIAIIAVFMSIKCYSDKRRIYLLSALLFTISTTIVFCHNMTIQNNWRDIFNSTYDITYFDSAIPFLLMSFVKK